MPTAPQTADGRRPGLPWDTEAEEAEGHPGRAQRTLSSSWLHPWCSGPGAAPLPRQVPRDPCGGSVMSVPAAPLLGPLLTAVITSLIAAVSCDPGSTRGMADAT
eukprot:4398255-Pyramimonas_sp.AAC.1